VSSRTTILGLCAGIVAVPVALVIGLLVVWWLGILVGVLAGAAGAYYVWNRASDLAERAYGVGEVWHASLPTVENVVDGICLANGIAEPRIALVDTAATNAALLGREDTDLVLVITTGLLDSVDRMGVEAVTGHLLARDHDEVETRTLCASMPGWIPPALYSFVLGANYSRIGQDQQGLAYTRYPPALAKTLEMMSEKSTAIAGTGRVDDALWLAPAMAGGATDPDVTERIEDRIEVLREL
jgi:hypothetical protein